MRFRSDLFQARAPDKNRNDEPEDPIVEAEDELDCWPAQRDDDGQAYENLHGQILSIPGSAGRFCALIGVLVAAISVHQGDDMDLKLSPRLEVGVIC